MQGIWIDDDFYLEFQEGSIDEHYRAIEPLNATQAVEAFHQYLWDSEIWRAEFSWEKLDLRGRAGRAGYRLGAMIGKVERVFKQWLRI